MTANPVLLMGSTPTQSPMLVRFVAGSTRVRGW